MKKKMQDLTTGQVASYTGVSLRTVINWINKGLINAYKLPGKRGDHRIKISDLLLFYNENKMPIPEDLILENKNIENYGEKNQNHRNKKNNKKASRALIIDDEENMAKAISRLLKRLNLEVKIVTQSFEAGMACLQFEPNIITLDLQMQGMNGFDVLNLFKAYDIGETKIIVISSLDQFSFEKAYSLGAHQCFNKPIDEPKFITYLNSILN